MNDYSTTAYEFEQSLGGSDRDVDVRVKKRDRIATEQEFPLDDSETVREARRFLQKNSCQIVPLLNGKCT